MVMLRSLQCPTCQKTQDHIHQQQTPRVPVLGQRECQDSRWCQYIPVKPKHCWVVEICWNVGGAVGRCWKYTALESLIEKHPDRQMIHDIQKWSWFGMLILCTAWCTQALHSPASLCQATWEKRGSTHGSFSTCRASGSPKQRNHSSVPTQSLRPTKPSEEYSIQRLELFRNVLTLSAITSHEHVQTTGSSSQATSASAAQRKGCQLGASWVRKAFAAWTKQCSLSQFAATRIVWSCTVSTIMAPVICLSKLCTEVD